MNNSPEQSLNDKDEDRESEKRFSKPVYESDLNEQQLRETSEGRNLREAEEARQTAMAKEELERKFRKHRGTESPEQEKRFEEILSEYKADFEQGKIGFCVQTKIHYGKRYRGYQENNEAVELDEIFKEPGNMPEKLAKRIRGFSVGKTMQFWWKSSDVSFFLAPEEITTYKKARGIRGFFGKEERGGERALLLKDFGFSGEDADEELCNFSIVYSDRSGPGSGYKEVRPLQTHIDFVMKKSLAEKILSDIKADPKNIRKFIEEADQKLLEVTSPVNIDDPRIDIYDVYKGARHEWDYPEYRPTEFINKRQE